MLRIDELTNLADIESVKDQWLALEERRPELRSFFLSYDWFHACASNLQDTQRLLVLTLRRGSELVGIAPFLVEETRQRGLRVRNLSFLSNPLSPFVDFLWSEQDCTAAVIEYLHRRKNWDVFALSPNSEVNANALRGELLGVGLPFDQRTIAQVPYLPITMPWEDFYGAKSRKFRMTRRSIANRVARLHGVEVKHFTDVSNCEEGLELLLRVSRQGWKQREGLDRLTPEFEARFLGEVTRAAAIRGSLHIWVLTHEGKAIAAEYHLQDGATVYGLRAHFDEEYSFYSPGSYLDFEIVKWLHEAGVTRYDMGPGTAFYKMAWTDLTYPVTRIEAYNRTGYAKVLRQLNTRLLPAIKRTAVGRQLQKLVAGAGR